MGPRSSRALSAAEPREARAGEARTGPRPSRPQRTCIGCRAVRAKEELMRLVRDEDGGVRVDQDGCATGRGAYVCPSADCLEKALHAGRLGHAFKRASRPPRESAVVILASRTRR